MQQPDLPRDRTREFETPPPPPAPGTVAPPPARAPSWVSDVVGAAPLVLALVVVLVVLRRRRWRRLLLRALLATAVAGTVAGGAFYATYLAGCQAMQCVDTAGIVPMLAGVGIGGIAGLVALVWVWRATAASSASALVVAALGWWSVAGGVAPAVVSAEEPRLRVAAYNIRHGEGVDRTLDLARIADVLAQLDADVIALQEVDQGTDRTGRVDQAAAIAARLGYRGVHGAHRPFQGGAYGNAVLTRLPVRASRTHAVPPAAGQALAVLEVEVAMPGLGPVSVVSVHLAGSLDDRMAQAQAITRLFAAADRPIVLAGDFNGRPDDAAVAWLSGRWRRLEKNGPRETFPADRPDREIDFMMVAADEARLELVEHRVLPESMAADHRPLLAVFRVAGR